MPDDGRPAAGTPTLAVIGNVSIDDTSHLDQRGRVAGARRKVLGGAGLHVSRAATAAGVACAPVAVIGEDLNWIRDDPRLADLDLSEVRTDPTSSAAFSITYDHDGHVQDVRADYGAATGLTDHALTSLAAAGDRAVHICCRRPLDVAAVLSTAERRGVPFSVDFFVSSAADLVQQAAPYLRGSLSVFVNADEYRLLAEALPRNPHRHGPTPRRPPNPPDPAGAADRWRSPAPGTPWPGPCSLPGNGDGPTAMPCSRRSPLPRST